MLQSKLGKPIVVHLTWAISSGVVTGRESSLREAMAVWTAAITPIRTSCGLAPLDTTSNPSLAIDLEGEGGEGRGGEEGRGEGGEGRGRRGRGERKGGRSGEGEGEGEGRRDGGRRGGGGGGGGGEGRGRRGHYTTITHSSYDMPQHCPTRPCHTHPPSRPHPSPGQHCRRGSPIPCLVIGITGHILYQLGPNILVLVLQLYPLGNCHTILGDLGAAPRLLQDNIATLQDPK